MTNKNVSLTDTEREALVWKLAEDGAEQFWKRLNRTIVLGFGIVGTMLAVIGVSGYALLPSWIEDKASTAVTAAIGREMEENRKFIQTVKQKTLDANAEAMLVARQAETEAKILVESQKKTLTSLREQLDAVEVQSQFLRDQLDKVRHIAGLDNTQLEELANTIETVGELAEDVEDTELVRLAKKVGELERIEWETPKLLNGWANYDPGYAAVAFGKNAGLVSLKGVAKNGSPGTRKVMFVLPEGYRPAKKQVHIAANHPGSRTYNIYARIDIKPNGEVFVESGSKEWISLDGICFPTQDG